MFVVYALRKGCVCCCLCVDVLAALVEVKRHANGRGGNFVGNQATLNGPWTKGSQNAQPMDDNTTRTMLCLSQGACTAPGQKTTLVHNVACDLRCGG